MGTTINYAGTPKVGSATLGSFDASFTSPSNVSTIVTAGSSGSKVEEIVVQALATLAAGLVNLWVVLDSGPTYRLLDQVTLTTTPTASTTVAAARFIRQYNNLWLPNGYSLRASHTTTGNDTNKIAVLAFYADY
jgi:hypothetical protein